MNTTNVKEKELTKEEAIAMANEIERLEATIKQMKEQLKSFVDKNGGFSTNDKVWDYTESVSWKFKDSSLKELATMIALEGHNAWEMLNLPATALKKLDWDEAFLSKYGQKNTQKRFTSKKI
ncbi:hypothetical protein HRF87_05695 [Bacillus sp. CRN 9]|nr:hypothetical protein [Bacillus sp. CRN 9]